MKKTRPPVEPNRTARMAGVSHDAWCVYADGYKRAAEILVAKVNTTYELNTVVFPIIFLYRQYVELTLKEIIGYCRYLDNARLDAPGGHDLRKLWTEARTLIRRHLSDVSASDLDRIQAHIDTLSDLDPSSESSRYPRVKGRAPSFRFNTPSVNLNQLATEMVQLAKLLQPIGSALAVYRDYESELRSYNRDY